MATLLPKLADASFVPSLSGCISLLTNYLLRQLWVCGYTNPDFDLLAVIAQNPYLLVEDAILIVRLLSLVCVEDTIYASVAFIPFSLLIIRFQLETNMQEFVVEFVRVTVVTLAGMESAIAEENMPPTTATSDPYSIGFSAKKARDVHIGLLTSVLERIMSLDCTIYNNTCQQILFHVASEFQNIYAQLPKSLMYLLQQVV